MNAIVESYGVWLGGSGGQHYEYRALDAGALALGELRLRLRRLEAEGWELCSAAGPEPVADSGELKLLLRRGLSGEGCRKLYALALQAA